MLVGVKFCGGCNPRYDRGKALETIKKQIQGLAEFAIAEEGAEYDYLLVIGGCTNCCASYCQYKVRNDTIHMWDESHIEKAIKIIKNGRYDS
ncbi:MAG TPA: hypothetical protein VM577_20690 [Anaerovoracaceae bacterium]|nr:hypothetical protein [Anaerovoracaceae bacterium]